MEMKAQDFSDWIERMGISEREVSRQLGISRPSVAKYRKDGAPLYIALACAALIRGIKPWPE